MLRLVRDRLLVTLLTIWAAVTLAFFALRVVPGDALLSQMLQAGAPQEAIDERRDALGLNAPVAEQYGRYLAGFIQGNLGHALISRQPVAALIGQYLGATSLLAACALAVALLVGIGLGSLDGLLSPRLVGRAAGFASVLLLSSPIYWSGTLAIFIFSTQLGWFPATGSDSPRHLILPATVLGLHVAGSIARVTRTSLRQVRHADFVRTAYAKGLPFRSVALSHALRASLPPIISMVALQAGFLLGGTVITEMLFARQGLGHLLHRAVLEQDFPIVQGIVALSAVVYSLLTTGADLLSSLLDPRLRTSERG